MSDLLDTGFTGAEMSEAYIERVNNMTVLIHTLVRGHTPDWTSVGLGGVYSQKVYDQYRAYKDKTDHSLPYGFTSPGFGYSAETIAQMECQGFNTGPAVVVHCEMSNLFNGCECATGDTASFPFQDSKDAFEAHGIRCAIAVGGNFPDSLNSHIGLAVDAFDPLFLQRVKPLFLETFPVSIVEGIKGYFNHMFLRSDPEVKAAFIHGVVMTLSEALADPGEAVRKSSERGIQVKSFAPSPDMEEAIQGYVDYAMMFIGPAIKTMDPVLSAEEKQGLFKKALEIMAARGEEAEPPFVHQEQIDGAHCAL